jgi:hypothetical protein
MIQALKYDGKRFARRIQYIKVREVHCLPEHDPQIDFPHQLSFLLRAPSERRVKTVTVLVPGRLENAPPVVCHGWIRKDVFVGRAIAFGIGKAVP